MIIINNMTQAPVDWGETSTSSSSTFLTLFCIPNPFPSLSHFGNENFAFPPFSSPSISILPHHHHVKFIHHCRLPISPNLHKVAFTLGLGALDDCSSISYWHSRALGKVLSNVGDPGLCGYMEGMNSVIRDA